MKTLFLVLVMLPLSAWSLEKPQVSASRFFQNLGSEGLTVEKNAETIELVRSALGYKKHGEIGARPQNAGIDLSKAGFDDLLKKNPGAMTDQTKIPIGTIFVLSREKSKNCPVGSYGGIAVKCGDDVLFWAKHQTKKVSEFVRDNPGCIRAAMYLPTWTKTTRKEADAEGLNGQSATGR